MNTTWIRIRACAGLMLALVIAGCATGGPGLSVQDEIDALMKEGQQLHAAGKFPDAVAKFAQVVARDPKYWQAHVWAARSLIPQGKWPDAIASAKKAYEISPKGADVVPVLGEALFGGGSDALKNGRLADSVAIFVDYLKLEPGNTRAWLNVGKAYLGQGQFREALNAFLKGLSTGGGAERTDLIRGLLDGGVQAFSQGKFRDAIDLLKEYVKLDSNNLTAYVNLAKAYWESGERANALEAFRKVIQLNPRHEEALRFLLGR